MPPRVRFAPSPSGYLHVGGARTALFNWLYARRHGGTFILRIEDTDTERSSAESVAGIIEGMKWLGLDWDEGPDVGGPHAPYFQSGRLDRHRTMARSLISSGRAYYCYCTSEELAARRQAAESVEGGWKYDRRCLNLDASDVNRREAAGLPRTVRFRVPDGATSFDDLVHGRISVAHEHLDDFILLRSDGQPTYQLSVVADDVDMEVTHVVRGDDHISNTPKQVLLYQALDAPVPAFAHVPLILGLDKKRLSKRHGATAVGEYALQGYLPEAMINFLALLGWSPGAGDQEVFSRDELISRFALDGISGGGAVFNLEKLDWFNQQHIARMPAEEIARRIQPDLTAAGLWSPEFADARAAWLARAIDLVKPRAKKLADFVAQLRPFLVDRVERDPAAVAKHLASPEVLAHLAAWRNHLESVTDFDAATLESELRALADRLGVKPGTLIHATRVAVVGAAVSPGLFEVLELVGRVRVLGRLADVAEAA